MRIGTLAIVGVGLIGASIGRAVRARGVAGQVIGFDRSPDALSDALSTGAIDTAKATLAEAVAHADLILVCTPVDAIAGHVVEVAHAAKAGAIISDTGSTKATIASTLSKILPAGALFVGGHPMAGSEKKGPRHAREDLFDGRPILLTEGPPEAVAYVTEFWKALGGKPIRIDSTIHDHTVAFVSHLPHAVAAALSLVPTKDMLPLSAGGFRDTTRVAGAGAGIWEPIFRANRTAVLAALDQFDKKLNEFRQLVETDDGPGLERYLNHAKRVRDELGS